MTSLSELKVDPEFDAMLPELTNDEYSDLVASIRRDGITDPIIVWGGHSLIVDGHNRYRIWRHELGGDESLAPAIVEMPFSNRDEAKRFILERQLARRNLTPAARIEMVLKLKPFLSAKAKVNQTRGGGSGRFSKTPQHAQRARSKSWCLRENFG